MPQSNYFQGWYFKHQTKTNMIAFIVGYNQTKEAKKEAFLQIITTHKSYFIPYEITEFNYQAKPFIIQIGSNIFSSEGITINIHNPTLNLAINGHLQYHDLTPLKSDIMGPFAHFSFLQCYHGVLSLHHYVNGRLIVNQEPIDFNDDIGYIETDRGISFPKNYTWLQNNYFVDEKICVMVSVAHIPFWKLSFQGCLAIVYYQNEEYRFATYKGVRVICASNNQIHLKQRSLELIIKVESGISHPLKAPTFGLMKATIHEVPTCNAHFSFYKNKQLIFEKSSPYTSFEFVPRLEKQ